MTTDEQGYNGWTNYETWVVALWINNDQGWQESILELVREVDTEPDTDDAAYRAHEAGKAIRENVEEVTGYLFGDEGLPASLASDLLGHAMARVNWTELGAAFLSDLAEQDAPPPAPSSLPPITPQQEARYRGRY